jgi:hypothetical protein
MCDMKKIIAAATLFIGSIQATEASMEKDVDLPIQYRYVKLSDQWIFFPGLGLGYRFHNKNHGFNADLTAYSYWDAGFSLYGKGHYLFYPTREHLYLGIGAGVIGGYFSASFGGGPLIHGRFGDGLFIKPTLEGTLGYEWNTENTPLFLQLEVGGSYGAIPLYPALSFGIGF